MTRTMYQPPNPGVEAAAQALFERYCLRVKRKGGEPHHRPGTRVVDMPPSYRDDYIEDARCALAACLHAAQTFVE